MKSLLAISALIVGLAAVPAHANDTMSQLGTGGLVFITSDDVSMDTEDLSVSPKQVKVVYHFTNHSKQDQQPTYQRDGRRSVALVLPPARPS